MVSRSGIDVALVQEEVLVGADGVHGPEAVVAQVHDGHDPTVDVEPTGFPHRHIGTTADTHRRHHADLRSS